MKWLLFFLVVSGCAGQIYTKNPKNEKSVYAYNDESGAFQYFREKKFLNNRIITRNQLLDTAQGGEKVLEKSILVSQIGSVKSKRKRLLTVRPLGSEYTVWLEGKKYSSIMKLNSINKSMSVFIEDPIKKSQEKLEIKFPQGRYFCFYNQISECLYYNHLLIQATENRNGKFNFIIVWDAYPFLQDQYTRLGGSLFSSATIKFDGEIKNLYRYVVEVEGQIIVYHFTKSYDLVKVSWIAQGITILPQGEEISDE